MSATETDAPPLSEEHADAVRALEGELSRLLHRVRRIIAESAERVSPGMLPGTFRVFTTIAREEGMTLSGLAETLMADKGQMSRTVRELEELGFVARTPDPEDGRSSIITATPLGRDRLTTARTPQRDELRGLLASWPLDDVRTLNRLLHALTEGTIPCGPTEDS